MNWPGAEAGGRACRQKLGAGGIGKRKGPKAEPGQRPGAGAEGRGRGHESWAGASSRAQGKGPGPVADFITCSIYCRKHQIFNILLIL